MKYTKVKHSYPKFNSNTDYPDDIEFEYKQKSTQHLSGLLDEVDYFKKLNTLFMEKEITIL